MALPAIHKVVVYTIKQHFPLTVNKTLGNTHILNLWKVKSHDSLNNLTAPNNCLNSILTHFCSLFWNSIWQILPPHKNARRLRERHVPQHGEQMARLSRNDCLEEKKRGKNVSLTEAHAEVRLKTSTHSPSESNRGTVCILKCVFMSVWWVVPLCMILSALFAHSSVCVEAK